MHTPLINYLDHSLAVHRFSRHILAHKQASRIPIIAEIKPYSPINGDLLRSRTIQEIARQYVAGGAACLSMVTGKWFGGAKDMLNELARHTELPILRKDFIINKKQIVQSKQYGASAVLLTKKLLKAVHLEDLAVYALSIGVAPFVEVADQSEVEKLRLPSNAIIAVNNKDIANQETDAGDIRKSLDLAVACRATGAGVLVSASSIRTPEQVQRLFHAGFDAFLIGTSLLLSENIQNRLEQFSHRQDQAA